MSPVALWKWTKYHARIASEAPFRIATRLRHGLPELMLYFGRAPGDDLLCTGLIHALADRGQRNIWMMSDHPDLFAGNPDVIHVLPVAGRCERFAHVCKVNFRYLEYAAFDAAADRATPPARHAIAELCVRMGLQGRIESRPLFFPTPRELAATAWAHGKICIQSSGLAAKFPMLNKQWPAERFQEVVTTLRSECEFLQLGAASDPKLEGAQDLRGETSKRETGALLSHARLFLGNVGFAMHLARAVECPSVILYGGREAPWQSGYSCNANLYSPEPCAPCWRFNGCDYHRMCMMRITSSHVVETVREMLAKPRGPLTVDSVELPAPAA